MAWTAWDEETSFIGRAEELGVIGAAARFWDTVGHPQRGTPEIAALRDECEHRLVRSLGRRRYDRTFDRATAGDARALVAWGAHGGPVPGE
ncbi:hypothetical protein ABZ646_28220 [Streptomyces sp. NPDC007162]|uniref:hypothetical protein n=1 Tax=Streptomyces sp. NPDC007162 TaxID=3156917 RepID=UPI0033E4FD0D